MNVQELRLGGLDDAGLKTSESSSGYVGASSVGKVGSDPQGYTEGNQCSK